MGTIRDRLLDERYPPIGPTPGYTLRRFQAAESALLRALRELLVVEIALLQIRDYGQLDADHAAALDLVRLEISDISQGLEELRKA